MTDEIRPSGGSGSSRDLVSKRELVPLPVGTAVVYVEATNDLLVRDDGRIRAVSLDPREAFERAGDALSECVRVIGDRLAHVRKVSAPDEVTVEFTLTFEVEGKANIVPVLITGKAKTTSGIKITANWKGHDPFANNQAAPGDPSPGGVGH
jgi:hypothetical protein